MSDLVHRSAGAARPCTCPADSRPIPCAHRYALSDCLKATAEELIDYLRGKIDRVYEDRRPYIARMFDKEQEANWEGRWRDWELYRDERSRMIRELERSVEPMRREIFHIASLLAATDTTIPRIIVSDGPKGQDEASPNSGMTP